MPLVLLFIPARCALASSVRIGGQACKHRLARSESTNRHPRQSHHTQHASTSRGEGYPNCLPPHRTFHGVGVRVALTSAGGLASKLVAPCARAYVLTLLRGDFNADFGPAIFPGLYLSVRGRRAVSGSKPIDRLSLGTGAEHGEYVLCSEPFMLRALGRVCRAANRSSADE